MAEQNMNIKLVRAQVKDASEYVRIAELNTSEFNIVLTDPERVRREILDSIVYFIKVDGQTVGFISYIWKATGHAYISEVQVEPAFRGRGIGRAALEEILEELETADLIELHTHPDNPARHLYGRCGFVWHGQLEPNFQGSGQPRICMQLIQCATM